MSRVIEIRGFLLHIVNVLRDYLASFSKLRYKSETLVIRSDEQKSLKDFWSDCSGSEVNYVLRYEGFCCISHSFIWQNTLEICLLA